MGMFIVVSKVQPLPKFFYYYRVLLFLSYFVFYFFSHFTCYLGQSLHSLLCPSCYLNENKARPSILFSTSIEMLIA